MLLFLRTLTSRFTRKTQYVARNFSAITSVNVYGSHNPRATNYNFATDVLDKWPGNRKAITWIDDHDNQIDVTFEEVQEQSRKAANMLRDIGVQKGDVVMCILPRYYEWWIINLATLRLGAVICPGTVQLSSLDIQDRLQQSNTTCIICDKSTRTKVEQIGNLPSTVVAKVEIPELVETVDETNGWVDYHRIFKNASHQFQDIVTKSNETSTLFFTSGTTAKPKMAVHTQISYGLGHKITGHWLDIDQEDVHWNMSDTGWAKAAWSSFYAPWLQGSTIFVHHSRRFDVDHTLKILEDYPITSLCSAPTVYRMLVQSNYLKRFKPKALKSCVSAGEPLNPEVIKTWKDVTDIVIRDGYGQTETVLLCGNMKGQEVRPGSMGTPAPGVPLHVVNSEGQEAATSEEGDLAIKVTPERPVFLFTEYKNDPERTANSFRGDYYLTGDRAQKDEDGYIWFVARSDDVIITAGYRVGPFEVESALISHPAVVESAVVSSPDEIRGEIVKAFVVLSPEYSGSAELVKELQDHVKSVTAPFKYPRKIEFVENLPKTVSGKIQRNILKQQELNA